MRVFSSVIGDSAIRLVTGIHLVCQRLLGHSQVVGTLSHIGNSGQASKSVPAALLAGSIMPIPSRCKLCSHLCITSRMRKVSPHRMAACCIRDGEELTELGRVARRLGEPSEGRTSWCALSPLAVRPLTWERGALD